MLWAASVDLPAVWKKNDLDSTVLPDPTWLTTGHGATHVRGSLPAPAASSARFLVNCSAKLSQPTFPTLATQGSSRILF